VVLDGITDTRTGRHGGARQGDAESSHGRQAMGRRGGAGGEAGERDEDVADRSAAVKQRRLGAIVEIAPRCFIVSRG
jgi:hypothetical protein